MSKSLKIGITGGSGHIGHNLIAKLSESEHELRVLVHKTDVRIKSHNISCFKGDIVSFESMLDFCKDLDVIIHLAALISIGSFSRKRVFDTNLLGTKHIVNAARQCGVNRFIHFSSIHALVHEPFDEEMDESRDYAINSWVDYEKSKAVAEKWVMEQNSTDFEVIVLNPTSVIGPEDPQPSYMGEFQQLALNGKIPGVIPGGYDWVDVRDIVDATIKSVTSGIPGNRYLLSGNWHTIKELSDILLGYGEKKRSLPVMPLWLTKLGIPFLNIYAWLTGSRPIFSKESLYILQHSNRFISNEKARKTLGFKPRPLTETLKDSYIWFKNQNLVK